MINTKFEAYKLKRELKKSGINYEFRRLSKNKFGELDCENDSTVIATIHGLYHERNSNIQITSRGTVSERAVRTRTKKIPMILCLYDAASVLIPDDIVIINGKTFKVTGVVNIQEWSIIGDISLEVFDDGIHN